MNEVQGGGGGEVWTDKEKCNDKRTVVGLKRVWCGWIPSASVATQRATHLVKINLLFIFGTADIYTCKYTKCVCLHYDVVFWHTKHSLPLTPDKLGTES